MNETDFQKGLYPKYEVKRISDPEGKHDNCRYFVLDPVHDPLARFALRAYMVMAKHRGYGSLARDLAAWLREVRVNAKG